MTEYRDNTLLRGLLLEAAAEDLDALLAETGEVDTTPRFRKSMAALVADPKGWAKRRQRPVWRRAARMETGRPDGGRHPACLRADPGYPDAGQP